MYEFAIKGDDGIILMSVMRTFLTSLFLPLIVSAIIFFLMLTD